MYLQVKKKKKKKPVLIQVKPTIAILNRSASHYLSKQRQRAGYRSWRRWRRRRRWERLQCSQQLSDTIVFGGQRQRSFRCGGVVGCHFDFRQSRAAEQRCGGGGGGSDWILWIGIWFLCCYAFQRLFEDCWSVKRHMYA